MVEGYTDVIGLAQAGIANVVATCGTALGEKHFELLSRFAQRAVLVVRLRRGRRAGGRACLRVPGAFPVQAVVMIMPDGLDPAEFVAKHGADAVRAGRDQRPPARRVHGPARDRPARPDLDRRPVRGRRRGAAAPRPAPRTRSAAPSTRGWSPTSPASARSRCCSRSQQRLVGQAAGGRRRRSSAAPPPSAWSARWLRLIAAVPIPRRDAGTTLTEDHFRNATNRRLFVALRDAGGDVAALAGGADQKLAGQVAALAVEPLEGDPTPSTRPRWPRGSTSSC